MQKTIVLSLSLFAVLALSALEFPPRQPEDLLFEDFSALEPGDAVPPGWNIKGDRSCFKLVKDAGKTVLEIRNPAGPQKECYLYKTIALDPRWETLRLSGTASAPEIQNGEKPWHTLRIMPVFRDKQKKNIPVYRGEDWYRTQPSMRTFSQILQIPTGAADVTLQIGFLGGFGTGRFRQVRLTPASWSNIDFPAAEKIPPVLRKSSATRSELLLNGVWKFRPVREKTETGYGYIRVPGVWAATHSWLIPPFDSVPRPPENAGWTVDELKNCYDGMYEKELEIPAEWKDRRIFLTLDRVCSFAEILVDGKSAGTVGWPCGKQELTDWISPGKKCRLNLLVHARPRGEWSEDFAHYVPDRRKGEIYNRGLAGSITLHAQEKGPSIESLFIRTSVRKKEMEVDVELLNPAFSGPAQIQFLIREWKSEDIVRRETFSRTLRPGKELSIETFRFSWNDPKLWDFQQPNLYTLEVIVRTSAGTDALRERFGFREFRISGKDFLLNETKIRLRPIMELPRMGGTEEVLRHHMNIKMAAGFNIVENCMNNRVEEYGSIAFRSEQADICDESGFLQILSTVDFYRLGYRQPIPDEMAKQWEKEFVRDWKRFRNHPSVVMLAAGFNRFSSELQRSPMAIGNGKRLIPESGPGKTLMDSGNRIMELMRKHDPTRPAISHDSSGVGAVHTSNVYLNFIPLQEREMWLSEYAKNGDRPYMAIEFGCPDAYSFSRGRSHRIYSMEPLATEWLAVYLGERAFAEEPDSYRNLVTANWQAYRKYSAWNVIPKLREYPMMQEFMSLFIRNTWRSWRTYGIPGGMVPWGQGQGFDTPKGNIVNLGLTRIGGTTPVCGAMDEFEFNSWAPKYANPAGKTLLAHNGATLAYIGGKKDSFVSKDHTFRSGETLEKQLVVINDTRGEASYDFSCRMVLNGEEKAREIRRMRGSVGAAENAFVPIAFPLPRVRKKTEGRLILSGTVAGREHRDEFPFAVVPAKSGGQTEIRLFDRDGKTAERLKDLGYRVRRIVEFPKQAEGLVIVGERSMDMPEINWQDADRFVRNGGRLLLLADTPEYYRSRFGFRVAPHIARRCYPVQSAVSTSPFFREISPEDLRDWRGDGTLVPAASGVSEERFRFHAPPYGFHWGNKGSVCSAPLEKPHASGWLPLFETEFSLAYSPLMELRIGRGLVRLCTFDFISRTEHDPAADNLFHSLISDTRERRPAPLRETFLIGGTPEEKNLLKKMGVLFRERKGIPESPAPLLILGKTADLSGEAFRKFLESGGHAVLLPRSSETPGFQVRKGVFGVTKQLPSRIPVLRGLSLSDFHFKADVKGEVLLPDSPNSVTVANGLIGIYRTGNGGEAVRLQLLPGMLRPETLDYMKNPAWRVMRILSRILANSGAAFRGDESFLTRDLRREIPSKLEFPGSWKAEFERREPRVRKIEDRLADGKNLGEERSWHLRTFDDRSWNTVPVGGYYQGSSNYFGDCNGVLWYRRTFHVPKEWKNWKIHLDLGVVDDMDTTYFNGVRIGRTDKSVPLYWVHKRRYPVPSEIIRFGAENTIAVRVFDDWALGGILNIPKLVLERPDSGVLHLYSDDYNPDRDGDDVYLYYNW